MTETTRHPPFRGREIKIGLRSMLCYALFMLLIIPNDLALIGDSKLRIVAVGVRIFFFFLSIAFYFHGTRNIAPEAYTRLTIAISACTVLANGFFSWTRPPEYVFSFVPSLILVSYLYFLLPSPTPVKIVFSSMLTGMELCFVLTNEATPVAGKLTIGLSLAVMNLLGVIHTLVVSRLRMNDWLYRNRLEDRARFKQALSDTSFEGVLLHRNNHVVDCNQPFIELASQIGVTENQIRQADVDRLIRLDADALEPYTRGDPVRGRLSGRTREIPVDLLCREILIGDERYISTMVRDRSRDEIETMMKDAAREETDPSLQSERIRKLPLSKREQQIVSGLAAGHSLFRIADDLFVSDETVNRHLATIYRKLGIRTSVELMRLVLG
jgi:Response regulator containing a CheY-like receiver domain and an HTH DNA-binding domain